MRATTYIINGTVTDYRNGVLTIKAPCDDWELICKREVKKVKVQLLDGRTLSHKQRNACYAMIGEIADFIGDDKISVKEYMKMHFWAERLDDLNEQIFSLSDAPMSLVADFQRFLVRFIVSNGIPTKWPLLNMVDDIGDYIYACLINKKCVISGKPAELHHIDRVGIGRDRHDIIHEGMEVIPLAREYHEKCHIMGDTAFMELYHLDGGVVLDKTLCKIYGLKAKKENHAESH